MKLYNTATRKIELIEPIKPGHISLYTCGPTVYDKPTIGNWASFIRYDILARSLRIDGYDLNWVMNITDVGHLVSDADEGEDKLEKGARREGKTAWEVAKYYSDYFLEGLQYLNISVSKSNIIRATDKINEQIKLVETLEKKGHTYATDDGIYFDSTTFPNYGKMARLDISGLQKGFRVETGGKKHTTDFALWKFSPKDKIRDMQWDSPWGKGFPGWHLECSAIILSSLGQSIDIHGGGIEHIPIHHTNEIAQSESATDKPLAKTWVHNNHLQVNGEKISKSLNNGFTLENLKEKGYSSADFRMFVVSTNYRNEANFTWQLLEESKIKRLQLQSLADLRFQTVAGNKNDELKDEWKRLKEALTDNLNTSEVSPMISRLSSLLSHGINCELTDFKAFLQRLDEALGFDLLSSEDITEEQKSLITLRNRARDDKNWAGADKIRNELLQQNIELKDVGESSIWSRTV